MQARLNGDWEQAVDRYAAALRLWSGLDDCLYYLANSLIELERDAGALAVLERLVHFEPQSSQAWLQGDRERAKRLLQEAHDLSATGARSDSVSSEGDTRTGVALTGQGGARLDPRLERWRSLGERGFDAGVDIDGEYRAH